MSEKKYIDKLKDPRWQKKRLEILERDDWCCQRCFDHDSTLHVHHRVYLKGTEPWDIDNNLLVTLCEECHPDEQECMKGQIEDMSFELKVNFFHEDVNELKHAICLNRIKGSSSYIANVISHWLENDNLCESMVDEYQRYLESVNNKRKRINDRTMGKAL